MSAAGARPVARQRIRSMEDAAGPVAGKVFCPLFCGLSLWMFYHVAFRVRDVMGSLITGLFAVLGLLCVAYTVRQVLSRRKFGETSVLLDGGTPVAGGELAGFLLLPAGAVGATFVHAEMHCLQIVLGKDLKGRITRSQKRIWMSEKSFEVVRAGARSQAPFRFELPGAPLVQRGTGYIWELHIKVALPGLDLSRTFDIPVDPPPRTASGPVRIPGALDGGGKGQGSGPATAPVMSAGIAGAAAAAGSVAARTVSRPLPEGAASRVTARPAAQAADAGEVGEKPLQHSAWVLLLANLVPLAGVLWLNWRVLDVVLLYWLENLIIGVMNVLRILSAQPEGLLNDGGGGQLARPMLFKLAVACFFMLHFGAFCYGHGMFLTILFGEKGDNWEIGRLLAREMADPAMLIPVVALAASHLYSFRANYLGRGENRKVTLDGLMMGPYGRIMVIHISIVAGGFIVMDARDQLWLVLLFVVLKIIIDLYIHHSEHRRLAAR